MTYDATEVLSNFADDEGLRYALLSDPDGAYMATLGIRNEAYESGHPGFGIPHPGVMLIDPSRSLLYKAAEEDYRVRPPFDTVFDAVRSAVGTDGGTAEAETPNNGD